MSIESGTYSFLTSKTGITNLVGARIYPNHLPQSPVFPALTYTLIDAVHDHTLPKASGIVSARIQFDVFSHNLSECVAVIEAIRQALQRYTGSYGTEEVLASKCVSDRNLSEAPQDGSQNWLYRKSSDYLLKLRESIP